MSSIEIYTCTLGKLFRSVLKVEVTLCVNRGPRPHARVRGEEEFEQRGARGPLEDACEGVPNGADRHGFIMQVCRSVPTGRCLPVQNGSTHQGTSKSHKVQLKKA